MRRRRRTPVSPRHSSDADAALETMSEDELRQLIRDIIPWLEEASHSRLANMVIARASHSDSGWAPAPPTERNIARILAFAESAVRDGYADPEEVDDCLRQASNAFLARDYGAALRIFRALLLPMGEGAIHLGEHEMLDEVLNVDVAACAAHYVVATYMTEHAGRRAEAVRAALNEIQSIGSFWEPLRKMERVAVEPLPELDQFLSQWKALLESSPRVERHRDHDTDEDRWLREVVGRLEGPDGLARIARTTKRPEDLSEWCRALVERKDWEAALAGCEEAAQIVSADVHWRGRFFEGAALAAQELGRGDLPQRLERAWREAPSLLRLRRWLGSSDSSTVAKERASEAIGVCPTPAQRQRALLHVLLGELTRAAKLLASAPGMGWSNDEHPGHLLVSLFCRFLGVAAAESRSEGIPRLGPGNGIDEEEVRDVEPHGPVLADPTVEEIIALAGIGGDLCPADRTAILKALRTAAEKRIAGVTKHKRRSHYGHAAMLAAACVAAEPTPETEAWLDDIRTTYRRFSALQAELTQHCKAVQRR
ncbi:hypothetical protein JXA88_14375 [Candidatus Fermentibacteria bacterium]|nr:hypothetical protein [Candidatus Fermentibacteria bacterium]